MAAAIALPITLAAPAGAVVGPIPAPEPQVLGTRLAVPDLAGRELQLLPEGVNAPGVRVPPAQEQTQTQPQQTQPQQGQQLQQPQPAAQSEVQPGVQPNAQQQPIDRQERARQTQSEEYRTERVRTEVIEYVEAMRTPDLEAAEQNPLGPDGLRELVQDPTVSTDDTAVTPADPAQQQPQVTGLLPELDALLEALGLQEPQPTSPRILPAQRPAPRPAQ